MYYDDSDKFKVIYEDGDSQVFEVESEAQAEVDRCENAYYVVYIDYTPIGFEDGDLPRN